MCFVGALSASSSSCAAAWWKAPRGAAEALAAINGAAGQASASFSLSLPEAAAESLLHTFPGGPVCGQEPPRLWSAPHEGSLLVCQCPHGHMRSLVDCKKTVVKEMY